MNIYDQISFNKRRTWVVVSLYILIIGVLGYVLGEIFGDGAGLSTMIVATVYSFVSAFLTYYYSDKLILGISNAKPAQRDANPLLYGLVDNLCVGSGMKVIPVLYVIDDPAPNAFATGRDPDHSAIAVTSGLLEKLDKRELEAVLAHELSHIRNYDIRLMTIVIVLVGTISIVSNILLHRGHFGSSDRNNNGVIMLISLLLAIITPLAAKLIELALSRNREYLADASASLLTRDPLGLASALGKIAADTTKMKTVNDVTAYLYIENPYDDINREATVGTKVKELFSTHPPVEERIKRLKEM